MYKGKISIPHFNITHKFSTKILYVRLILMRILHILLLQCALYDVDVNSESWRPDGYYFLSLFTSYKCWDSTSQKVMTVPSYISQFIITIIPLFKIRTYTTYVSSIILLLCPNSHKISIYHLQQHSISLLRYLRVTLSSESHWWYTFCGDRNEQ